MSRTMAESMAKDISFMKAFIAEAFLDSEVCQEQLRALWTAFCIHHGLDVDTAPYDGCLAVLWGRIFESDDSPWDSFDQFDGYMCAHLV